jgi:tRNA1Val (adenine37-N6)-methyltransferase
MSNSYFQFKQFTIHQDHCAMKVTTDGCLFGAWTAERIKNGELLINNCLDIGTGTGLLTLMLAQKSSFPIDAIEMDKDAFEQASENIAASPWTDRIKIFYGDAREFEFLTQYDVIISNPPFYEKELQSDNTKRNLAHHNEGLLFPELLSIIKRILKPGGIFFLLLPYKRNKEIKKLITEQDFFIEQMTFVKQSANHDYFRFMLAGKLKADKAVETVIDEIFIKDEKDQYTTDFINLLKDYYLHLRTSPD